jgi:hypothetical protein
VVAATEAFTGPFASATVRTNNVTAANGVGLNVIDTHEGGCIDNGDSSNTAASTLIVLEATPHASAYSMRRYRHHALLTQHHPTATQVVRMHNTARQATAPAVGERQYGALTAHNEMGCVHRPGKAQKRAGSQNCTLVVTFLGSRKK